MSLLTSILTDTTCGFPCWMAQEKVCRCSCGGKNHGVLKKRGGVQPAKQSKINGFRYELYTVGPYPELNGFAQDVLTLFGFRQINAKVTHVSGVPYHLPWAIQSPGSPVVVKLATKDQMAKWDELKGKKRYDCYLMWKRVEGPEPLWCEDDRCPNCNARALRNFMAPFEKELRDNREYDYLYGPGGLREE